jgi:5-methylcytosine-specific restriction enzyme A
MPARLPRACRIPGCPYPATDRGRCAVHAAPARAERQRFAGLYGTQRWRRESRRFIAEHPLCINAHRDPRCTLVTELVDHVIPHRGDATLFYRKDNWAAMCRVCHGVKTRAEVRA